MTTKMADLNSMKDECLRKHALFESLLRRYNPTGFAPTAVLKMYEKWDDELSNALSSLTESVCKMTNSHKAAEVADEWNKHVEDSEKKFRDNLDATLKIVAAAEAQAVASRPASAPAVETSSSLRQVQAADAEVKVKIEAKRISEEGKELDNDIIH